MQYYSNILCHENSIIIKAIPNKNNSTKIIYHSIFLNHIIYEEMWGPNPASTRRLPTSPIPYSYHDYLTAWFRFMLHQNGNMFIQGLLILTRISILICLSGSSASGTNLVLLLKYSRVIGGFFPIFYKCVQS